MTEIKRITVALTKKVQRELAELRLKTRMSKTDLVNRSISLYAFYETQRTEGKELALYDPHLDVYEKVHVE